MSRELSGNKKTTEYPRYSGALQPLTEQRQTLPTVEPQPVLAALEPLPASVLATVTRLRTQTPRRKLQPLPPSGIVSTLPTLAPLPRLPVVTPTQPVQLAKQTTVISTLAPTLPTLTPLPQLPLIAPVQQPRTIAVVSHSPTLVPIQPVQQATQQLTKQLSLELIQLPTIQQIPNVATSPEQQTIKLPTLVPAGQHIAIETGTKVPTIPTNPEAQTQYTRELQLAPLSPRSPRIGRKIPPAVVTHPTKPVATETCCVCYDQEIPTTNLLGCKHPLCGECIGQLRTPECPMCKQFIEGPLVTDEMLINILQRQDQARMDEETANYLAGLYLEENPEADPEEVYARYRNIH